MPLRRSRAHHRAHRVIHAVRAARSGVAGALLLAACANPPVDVVAPRTQLVGRVIDAATGAPLAGVALSTTPSTSAVEAAADGAFAIANVVAGQYELRAARQGYENATAVVTVRDGETTVADVRLRALVPELALAPAAIDLGGTLSRVAVLVQNRTAIGTVTWSAASDQPWLAVAPLSGTVATLPAELTLVVDRTMLPPGASVARLVVTSDAGTRAIDVRAVKDDPSAPRLQLSTTALAFGDTIRTLAVDVSGSGTGTLAWQASSSASWLTVSPASGTGPARLQVAVDRTGLTVGMHAATLTIASTGGTATVAVTLIANGASAAVPVWSAVATFRGSRATSVAATAASDVWVGGTVGRLDGGALHHWDGARWTDEESALGAGAGFYEVSGLDAHAGGVLFVVGTLVTSRAVIAQRTGSTFSATTLYGSAQQPYAHAPIVAIADPTAPTVWVAAYDGLLHRFDGATWTPAALGSDAAVAVRFASADDGWALYDTRLYHFDGGWSSATAPATSGMRDLALAPDGSLGVAAAAATWRRASGGTWTQLRDAGGRSVPSLRITLTGPASGWVITNAGLMRIAGDVLIPVQLPAPSTLVALSATSDAEAWLVGFTGDAANGYTTVVYRYR